MTTEAATSYERIQQILPNAISIEPVGSRVTCDPPPTDTDEDWLVLVRDADFGRITGSLAEAGFDLDNPGQHYRPELSTFNSWRGPNSLNLIITADAEWHRRFRAASFVAKRLNVMAKADRVALFQAVLYGNFSTP